MNVFYRRLLILLLPFITLSLLAQEAEKPEFFYKWFDKVVAVENTGLYNGIEYIEQHLTISGHQKFLKSTNFTPGFVVYNDQPYYEVDLKYNIYDDLLLIPGTGNKPLQLHKSGVKEFVLHGHHFQNITGDTTGVVIGFHEILLGTDNLMLLKKHRLKRKKFLDRSFTYFEFHQDSPEYAIAYGGEFFPANSRRDVVRAFPDHNREIRRFYRENRSKAKNRPDEFMIDLSNRLLQLSSF